MRYLRLLAVAVAGVAAWVGTVRPALAQDDPPVIMDFETIRHKPLEIEKADKTKAPIGTVEQVDGKVGKAAKFTFTESVPGFFNAGFAPNPAWNETAGFSFWVKGDGSKNFGGLEFIDADDYGLRYGYCFPLDAIEWKKITVPWRDLIPERSGPPIDAKSGYAPGKFANLWVGKWFYWPSYPPCSFTLDQVVLEKTIDLDNTDYTPKGEPLARLRAKLKAKQPATILFMGDSLTDPKHNSNQTGTWVDLLAKELKTQGADVNAVNVALGGRGLNHGMILMPMLFQDTPSPDLVVVWFGFNDWDNGVRGDRYQQYLGLAVDRIRRTTKGSADILLLTTAPAFKRWDEMKELEQAAREVAKEKNTGLGDTAAAFRAVGNGNAEAALKAEVWHWDNVHLGKKGKETVKDVVLKALVP